MKYSIPSTLLLVLTVVTIASCSKDKSDDGPTPPPSTDNTWKLNDFGFSRSVSSQNTTTYTNGNPFTQVNIDSKIATSNVNFKTCNIVFWFNTNTEGSYSIKSKNTVASFTTVRNMNVTCIVSNAAGAGAIYESGDTNIPVTVTKVNNKFVITATAPITVSKTLDDGLQNAPTTMTLNWTKLQ